MQSDVAVGEDAITGTLNFIEGGLSPSGWLSGDGHFLALKFSTEDWDNFDKVEVGLDPSQGSGLVDVKPDPDKNGVFKITNNQQKFVVKTTAGEDVVTKEYSLINLYLAPQPVAPFAEVEVVGATTEEISGVAGQTSYTGTAPSLTDPITDQYTFGINKTSQDDVIVGLNLRSDENSLHIESYEGSCDLNYKISAEDNSLIADNGFSVSFMSNGTYCSMTFAKPE